MLTVQDNNYKFWLKQKQYLCQIVIKLKINKKSNKIFIFPRLSKTMQFSTCCFTFIVVLIEVEISFSLSKYPPSSVAEPKLFIFGSTFVYNFGSSSSYSHILPLKTVIKYCCGSLSSKHVPLVVSNPGYVRFGEKASWPLGHRGALFPINLGVVEALNSSRYSTIQITIRVEISFSLSQHPPN